jgi:hypothetical protein
VAGEEQHFEVINGVAPEGSVHGEGVGFVGGLAAFAEVGLEREVDAGFLLTGFWGRGIVGGEARVEDLADVFVEPVRVDALYDWADRVPDVEGVEGLSAR